MATVKLLANADVSNDWTLSTGSDVNVLLQDNYTGSATSDSNYLSATATGKVCIVQLQNFTEDHSSIDGVRLIVRATNATRSQTYDLETQLLPVFGTAYYTESTGTENANRFYLTHSFTNRTTYDGSNAWDNSRVNGLKVSVKLDAHSGGTTQLTQVYVKVQYTEPVAAADNSIFFGTNF